MSKTMVGEIRESAIAQGDLVLIINNERPTKSGFWRKMREGETADNKVYYILEKPIHKDFDTNDKDLKHTHKENGLFVMKGTTMRYDANKYNILADIRGTDVVKLVQDNYSLDSIDINSSNVKYTKDFIEFLEIYKRVNKPVRALELVATNYIG